MMKTKLVYVLTCAPEATYIEQALMAVYSARHWNPDATIVLLTDDLTSAILHAGGPRGEILQYVSEEIVIAFEADKSMLYRSRWIKTKARELVKGDMLFVDCDTICCKPLDDVDKFECVIGACGDNNTIFNKDIGKVETCKIVSRMGCNIESEQYYFSSGALYVKDCTEAYKLYSMWHENWLEGLKMDIRIDQPSLAKANIECGHIISPIPDVYNCVLYTQNKQLKIAVVLHVPSYQNTCYLFTKEFLQLVKNKGFQDWMKNILVKPHSTYLPFDYEIRFSNIFQRIKWCGELAESFRIYAANVDSSFVNMEFRTRFDKFIKFLLSKKLYNLGLFLWMICVRTKLLTKSRDGIKENQCTI